MENALIIFIKNPQLGKAKTRLAATLGKEKALEIYLFLLAHTRQVAEACNTEKHLYYSEFIDEQDDWSNNIFQKHLQDQNPDLGQKMNKAFSDLATFNKLNLGLVHLPKSNICAIFFCLFCVDFQEVLKKI